ncbi:hypothetical protein CQA18_27060, partial [Enterobacter hormaechei]
MIMTLVALFEREPEADEQTIKKALAYNLCRCGTHLVQQGFVDEQAAQCGYCTNGMIMTLVALFEREPEADEQTIKK